MLKYSDFKYDLCCLGIRGVIVVAWLQQFWILDSCLVEL